MIIHALIPVHNSADCIIPCLESLVGKVDNIIILDNRWIGFGDDKPESKSTDGTETKILEFMRKELPHPPITYIYLPDRKHQFEARTYLINQVPDGDWFLNIDSDEEIIYWHPHLKTFLELIPNNFIGFRILWKLEKNILPRAGICRKISGLKWSRNHRLLELEGRQIDPLTFQVIPIRIDHQSIYNTKKSRVNMEKYEFWLHEYEQNIKDEKP